MLIYKSNTQVRPHSLSQQLAHRPMDDPGAAQRRRIDSFQRHLRFQSVTGPGNTCAFCLLAAAPSEPLPAAGGHSSSEYDDMTSKTRFILLLDPNPLQGAWGTESISRSAHLMEFTELRSTAGDAARTCVNKIKREAATEASAVQGLAVSSVA
jgi:hypothetical protein